MSGYPCTQLVIVLGGGDKFTSTASAHDGARVIGQVKINAEDEHVWIQSSDSLHLRRLAQALSEAADKADAAIRPVIA